MKSKIAIYLAGSTKKGTKNQMRLIWTDKVMSFLKESF